MDANDSGPCGQIAPGPGDLLVLEAVRFERQRQLDQVDALDAKAAMMVGFVAAVLALIGAVVVTRDWVWSAGLMPATVAAAHAGAHGLRAARVREMKALDVEDAYQRWGTAKDGLLMAISTEMTILAENQGVVDDKVEELERAQGAFATTVGLLLAAVTGIFLVRLLWTIHATTA